MTFHPYGDSAILINFEQRITEEINTRVIALYHAIQAASLVEISFYIPAYCSLTVGYDSSRTDYKTLYKKLLPIAQNISLNATPKKRKILHIPVCYDAMFALDIHSVMQQTGLSKKEIVALHTGCTFRVYMLGFLPGFAYLGKLPEALYCERKMNPRTSVPSRSVGIAGYQTGIYPLQAPGGWQIIGRTPVTLFDGKKPDPFLCKAGDRIKFRSVSLSAFQAIEKDVALGRFNIDSYL